MEDTQSSINLEAEKFYRNTNGALVYIDVLQPNDHRYKDGFRFTDQKDIVYLPDGRSFLNVMFNVSLADIAVEMPFLGGMNFGVGLVLLLSRTNPIIGVLGIVTGLFGLYEGRP